ncbi:H-type lectin domain-containing protein, partial [Burkholderia pseudomallei]|uniref:H-type lectin domain-containing protein n=1 Tax=Burkholderia pseudomallei TaxID=28450 RepID=UPI0013FEC372|nr:hypothetical protein [Burkholderia pseudomallei]
MGGQSHLSSGGDRIAHPADSASVASGVFNTQDVRSWDNPQLSNSNTIAFPQRFRSPPTVRVALNSIDIDHTANLRISATVSDVTSTGLTWYLDAWEDTILYSAGGAYIALR